MSEVRLLRMIKGVKLGKSTYTLLCSFQEIDGFEVGTKATGDFLVHSHRERPTVVVGNSEGIGRLKLVSACDIMDLE